VGSIVNVAKTLGLNVTAEGIETDAQIEFVSSLGCTEAQGYRFGTPLPYEQLLRTLPSAAPALRLVRGA